MSAAKHPMSAEVTARNAQHVATEWRVRCGRHAIFGGTTYASVEDQWRQHVYEETGKAPEAWGDTTGERWQP